MTVLQTSPEYYIQQCSGCGAVLKYSKHDIYIGNTVHHIQETDTSFWTRNDSIICPVCGYIQDATKERFDMITR